MVSPQNNFVAAKEKEEEVLLHPTHFLVSEEYTHHTSLFCISKAFQLQPLSLPAAVHATLPVDTRGYQGVEVMPSLLTNSNYNRLLRTFSLCIVALTFKLAPFLFLGLHCVFTAVKSWRVVGHFGLFSVLTLSFNWSLFLVQVFIFSFRHDSSFSYDRCRYLIFMNN